MQTANKQHPAGHKCLAAILILLLGWGVPRAAFSLPQKADPSPIRLARTGAQNAAQTSGGGKRADGRPPLAFDMDQKKEDGVWIAASPVLLGIDPQALEAAAEKIGRMKGIYSLLLIRDGFLVVEQYFREGYRTKPHNLKSASKSVISALIGIAVKEGLLHLDQPICDIIPGTKEMNDPRKADITVTHLLTMTSGLKPTSYQAYNAWVLNGDWVRSALDQPLVADPGTHFQYSTGNTHLLSAVLTAASGMSTRAYAERKLFEPMGITIHGWDTDPKGIYQGGNNLQLIPRDMARIGQLYLDGGVYRGRQLIPKAWIAASTRPGLFGKNDVYGKYGYLWFSRPGGNDAFVAVGFGGQYIYVSKEHRSVLVTTATLESKGRKWEKRLFGLIHDGIFGAVRSGTSPALRLAARKGTLKPVLGDGSSPRLYPISQTTRNVILREKPNRRSRRLGLVPSGTRIDILETRNQWHRTTYGGRSGWLFSPYVNLFISEKPEPLSAYARLIASEGRQSGASATIPLNRGRDAPNGRQMSENGRAGVRLNLRTGPSQADSVIRILDAGTPLEVKEQVGSWYRVRAGSYDGWVYGEYVQMRSGKPALAAKRQTTKPVADGAAPPGPPADSAKALEALGDRISRLADRLSTSEQTHSYYEKTLTRFEGILAEEQKRSASYIQDREHLLTSLSDLSEGLRQQQAATRSVDTAGKAVLAEIDGLQTKVAALRETLGRIHTLGENQDEELAALNRSLGDQQAEDARSETERRRLADDLTGARTQMASLQSALADSNAAQDLLAADIAALKTALGKQLQADAAIRKERAAVAADLDGLRARLAPMDSMAETARADRKELGSSISALKTELAQLKAAGKKAVADRSSLTTALEMLSAKIDRLQTALAEARFDRELLKTDVAKAGSLSAEHSAALSEVKQALSGTSAKTASIEADLDRQQKALDQIGTRLGSFADPSATMASLRADLDGQKKEIDRLDAALQQMDKELKTRDLELPRNLNAGLSSAKEQIDTLKRAVAEIAAAGRKTAAELSEAKRAFADAQTSILRKTETDRAAALAEIDGLQTRVSALNETLNRVRSLRDTQKAALADLNRALGEQQELGRRSGTERTRLSERIAATQSNAESIRKALDDAGAIQEALSSDLNELKQAADRQQIESDGLETVSGRLLGLQNELQALKAAVGRAAAERGALVSALEKTRLNLADIAVSQQDARADRTRLRSEIASAGGTVTTQSAAISSAQSGLETQATAIAGINARLLTLQEQIAEIDESNRKTAGVDRLRQNEAKAEIEGLQAQIAQINDALNRDRNTQGQQTDAVSELNRMRRSQERTREQAKATEKAIISEQVWFRHRIRDLEAALEHEQTDRQAEMAQWQTEKDELKSAVSGSQTQVAALKAQLEKIDATGRMRSAEIKTARQETERQLETVLAEAREHRDAMQSELTKTQKMLTAQQAQARDADRAGRDLLAEVDGLRTRTAALNETLSRLRNRRDSQKDEIDRLERELKAVKDADLQQDANRRERMAEIDAIRQQLVGQQQALGDSAAAGNSRDRNLSAATEQIRSLQEALAASQSGQETLASELVEMRARIDGQESALLASNTARKTLETALASAEKQVGQLREEVKGLKDQARRAVAPPARQPSQPVAEASREPVLKKAEPHGAVAARAETDRTAELQRFALFWADAWQSKRVDDYLSCYSRRFRPAGGTALSVWQQQRWLRIQKPAYIQIELKNIRTRLEGPSNAVILFDQRYRSNTYSDQVEKTLSVVKETDGWKIMQETSR